MNSPIQLGDTELQRARRLARAYRAHLHDHHPDTATQLDQIAEQAGEGWWLLEQEQTVELDDLLTTAAAARLANVGLDTIRQWRKRGYIDRHGNHRRLTPAGRNRRGWPLFRAGDILTIAATTRHRRRRNA